MWNQSKKYKNIVIGILLVLVLIFGLSRVKLQSVDSFQKEQSQAAQELGLSEDGQGSESGNDFDENGQTGELGSVETGDPGEEQTSRPSQKNAKASKNKNHTPEEKKEAKKDSSDSTQAEEKNSTSQKTKKKKSSNNAQGNQYEPLGGTQNSSAGENGNKDNSSSDEKKSDSKNPSKQNDQNSGQNESNNSSSSGAEAQKPNDTVNVSQAPAGSDESGTKKEKITCTIQICCDELVKNKDSVPSSLRKYIPSDGMLLQETTVSLEKGATAYDVLSQVCKARSIALDAEYTAMYNSYYVKGIGYLYEKQAGDRSGWIYKVNGKAPNLGASGFILSDGDQLLWCYICDGIHS